MKGLCFCRELEEARASLEAMQEQNAQLQRQIKEAAPQLLAGAASAAAPAQQQAAQQRCERLEQELMQERLQHEQVQPCLAFLSCATARLYMMQDAFYLICLPVVSTHGG